MSIYHIADLIVDMECSGRTKQQAKPYLFDNKAKQQEIQLAISLTEDAITKSTLQYPLLNKDDCEYMLSGSLFYRQLLNFQGLLLHASAVVYEGKAYLFSAPCGTGKSTHTSLWLSAFPGSYILNDDKPAIRWMNGRFYAYGTPWSGKYDMSKNDRIPLQGICFLSQGEENKIEMLSKKEIIYQLLSQTMRKLNEKGMQQLLQLLDLLIEEIPVFHMSCTISEEAALLSYQTMSQKRE